MPLSDFFDPVKPVNYYNVAWVLVLLIGIGILIATALMKDTSAKTVAVIALSCGAILLASLNFVARIFYREKWNIMRKPATSSELPFGEEFDLYALQ